jgi:hypothetical protein
MASNAPTPAPEGARPKLPRWRRALVGTLVVLGCLLAPLAGLAVWLHNTLLDTDQYVETVGPLAENAAVQQAVATRVTNTIIEDGDIERRIADALPDNASFVAPFVTDGAERVIEDLALRVVESDQFAKLWDEVNRRAHTQVVAVLKGEKVRNVETKNGEVAIAIGPIVSRTVARLQDVGIRGLDNVEVHNDRVVLISSDQLDDAQSGVKLLDRLVVVLPIVMVSAFAVAIAFSGNRRRTVLRSALGFALAMAFVGIALNIGRSLYLNSLPDSVNRAAATAVYDQLVVFLRTGLRALFTLAVIVAIVAWLAGPSQVATRIRSGVGNLLGRRPEGATVAPSGLATFMAEIRVVLRVVIIGAGIVILLASDHPGPLAVLVTALLVAAVLLFVEVLARPAVQARAATPSGSAEGVVSST